MWHANSARPLSRAAATLWACSFALLVAPLAAAQDRDRVLEQFDKVQASIQTLRADFTETTHSALLKDPIVAKGRFYMTKPDSIRWEYSSPEEMRFVIRDDQYTGYFPAQKRAEKRDIHRWREQLFRFLGVGQASSELAEFYDISLAPAAAEMGDTYLLRLDPKKKRVRKRMDEVLFWIDKQSYLPVRVEYSSKNGTTRVIEFGKVEVNPDLAANLYHVELPADVKVTNDFSALSGFGATRD